MNKNLLFTLFLGFIFTPTFSQTDISSCAASPEPITIINGGVPLTIIGKGNQFNSWTETVDGFIIKQNKEQEFEYVSKIEHGVITLSGQKAADGLVRSRSKNAFLKATSAITSQLTQQKLPKVEAVSTIPSITSSIEVFTNTAMPTTGSIKVLCLLVDYPNMGNSYSKTDFENLLNQPNYNGTGSLKDYFTQSSFGKLDVTVDVIDWVTAPNDYEYYGNINGYGVARELVRFAVDQAELNGVDFSQYDNDNDGDVDGIMVVHAGQGAEEGAQRQYIWSHRSRITPVVYDGKSISDYIMNPETRASSAISTVGVYCHEFGHNLGLPDLYDTDGSSQGIGNWGLMGSASWLGGGKRPGGLSAWSKIKLGWQVPTEILLNGSYVLNSAATNEEIYLLDPGEGKEFFLLENRQKLGVDQALPGSGLAIWHIDDARFTNSIEAHKRVDVEEADGLNGLDGSSRGDAGDLFPGTSGNTAFNAVSNPNNQLYAGGTSPARILNIVQNADKTISFDVDFDNIKFSPYDTIAFQPTATGQSKEKGFSLKAYNYDFTVTSVTYPDGFSGTLTVGEVIPLSTQSEFVVIFNPMLAKNYKDNIIIEGVSNGVIISGEIKVKGVGLQLLFADDFETDKGWTLNGFERGMPQGLASDPATAFEGANVLGNVLGGTGEYDNGLIDREWVAESPSFSCYGYSQIKLKYQQWLNLSSYNQDFAYLDVSIDGGATWKQILLYGDWEIRQNSWWNISRDISDYIAWQEDVRIRFSLGETDASNVNGGWNIDDLVITGEAEPYHLEANLNYGPTGIGINKSRALTLKNGTSNNFTITNISLPAGYSTDLTIGSVINNGASGNFNILFTPLLKQPYNGTFTIEFTDGTVNYSEDIPITGMGDYIIFEDDFETLKGWLLSGGFEIGRPLGRGYDPIMAASGNNVLGTVLTGNGRYENNLTDRQWVAQSPVIDCSQFTNVKLNFFRFMQIDGFYDSAYVDISTNGGATWTEVWSTNGRWIGDWEWEADTIDISALADGENAVVIRFAIGSTDPEWTFAGWNIDDLSLTGDTEVAIQVTELINFGDVPVGESSAIDMQIKNMGTQDLVITEITYPTDFSGENYSGTLASGATKTISVSFDPTEIRDYQDTSIVVSNAATGNDRVSLTGKGLGSGIALLPNLDFGNVWVDSLVSDTIIIVNNGNVDLEIYSITHSDLHFSGTWAGTISAQDSAKVPIEFAPADALLYTNTMQVVSNASAGTGQATLSGTGVASAKHIQLSLTTLEFGMVEIDSVRTISLEVLNTGNMNLSVTSINSSNAAFTTSINNVELVPGQQVSIEVYFSPANRQNFTETLHIISDAEEGNQNIDLKGRGIVNKILVSGSIDFGEVELGTTQTDTVLFENEGDVAITVSEINFSDNVLSGNWAGIIEPGQTQKLPVGFTPIEIKSYEITIYVRNNSTLGIDSLLVRGEGIEIITGLPNSNNEFTIYPNPTNGVINLAADSKKGGRFILLNSLGHQVYQGNLTNTLNLSFLSNGVYSLVMENSENQQVIKIIIQH